MKGLVLLDWDNTVVDPDGHLNDPRLPEVIQSRVEHGWVIGLNSDTPMKRLLAWWRSLGLNGPIIAEMGAVVWWPGGQECILSEATADYARFREGALGRLSTLERHALFYGDSTHFVGSVRGLEIDDSALMALDAYRVCSLGLYVRRLISGRFVSDLDLARGIRELLEPLRPPNPLVAPIALNPDPCFLISNALDTDKAGGLRYLLDHWAQPAEVVMIGDSMADYLDVAGVRHFAVRNAQGAFQAHAEVIATAPYAQGCVELLLGL